MKIVITSTLGNFDPSYSLVTVIINQARMIKKHSEIPVEIWVLDGCADDYPEDLKDNVVKCLPTFTWESGIVDDAMVPLIQNAFQKGINGGATHILCHDLIFQHHFLTYNEAIRRIAGTNPGVKWYHWTHSAPHDKPIGQLSRMEKLTHTVPANSTPVYLNYLDLQRTAQMYFNTTMAQCGVVYNPMEAIDPTDITNPIALDIAKETKFREASVRVVYPFSTTRMQDKQVGYVLEILSILKEKGESVQFIACNCHANAQKEQAAIDKMIYTYTQTPYKLKPKDILFTSKFDQPRFAYSIPRPTVLDLLKLSNLFIFPTISECCPLILLEAAATNNLIVSNMDFMPLVEMTGPAGALFFKFSSTLASTTYGPKNTRADRLNYFRWVSENIIPELNRGIYQTRAMMHVQKNFSFEAVWNKQLRPLLNI